MKIRRFFAILLCFALLIGILPAPLQTKAAEIVRYEACYERYSGNLRYLDTIRVAINPDTGTADMSFKRKILHENLQYYADSDDEDDKRTYSRMCRLIENNYGRLQCKATVYNKQNDAIYGWRLTDLRWMTDPYLLYSAGDNYDEFVINSNKVDKTGVFLTGGVYRDGQEIERISFYSTTAGLDHPDTGFTMLRDNFGFSNRYSSFYANRDRYENKELTGGGWFYWGDDGYLLDQKTFNALIQGLSKSDKGQLFSWLNDRWNGSCMGMSIVSGLLYREKLNRNSFNATGGEVYDFDPPVKNKPLMSALQYYMWKGNLDVYDSIFTNGTINRSNSLMKGLIEDMLEEKDPLYVLGFSFTDATFDSDKRMKHAVLAYKAEKLDKSYIADKDWIDRGYATRLYIYDPNSPHSKLLWYVAEDGSFKIKSWNNYAEYNYPRLNFYEEPEHYLSTGFTFPKLKPRQIRIQLRGTSATVKIGDKKASLDGDYLKTGGLSMAAAENSDAEEENGREAPQVTLLIDDVDPNDPIEIYTRDLTSTGGNNDYARATVQTENGFYAAGADDYLTLTIDPDGTATLKPKKSDETSSLAVASDKTKGDLYAVTAEAAAESITVTPTEDGARIKTEKAEKADITVAGDILRAQFPGEETGEGDLIVRTEGKKAQILKEDESLLDEKEAQEPPASNWGTAPEEGDFPGTRPQPKIPETIYYYTGYEIVEDWKWNDGAPTIRIRMKYSSSDGDTSPTEELTLNGETTDPETAAYRTYTARTTAKYESYSGGKPEVVLKKKFGKDGNTGGSGGKTVSPEEYDEITWNLFYDRADGMKISSGGAKLTDRSGNLGKNTGKSAQYFDLTTDGTGLRVTLKDTIRNNAKKRKVAATAANSIIILPTYDKNGAVVGEFQYSLPVSYVPPKLRLSSTTGSIKKGAETILNTVVEVKKSTGTFEPMDLTEATVTGTGVTKNASDAAAGKLDISASSAAAVSVGIQGKDWSTPISLKYNVKASPKDVITATINGKSFQSVILNTKAAGSSPESFEVDVKLNGKEYLPGGDNTIKVTEPKKAGGFVISGIRNGELTGSRITISYPADLSNLVTGNYTYALKSTAGSYNLKIVVNATPLSKAVTLKTQTKLNTTTGQKLVLIPTQKGISGTIDSEVEIGDDRFEALYDASLNQISVSLRDGSEVAPNTKITTTLGVVTGGVKCDLPLSFTTASTKPTVKIDKVNVPKDMEDAFTAVNVRSYYKQGDQLIAIAPASIRPVSTDKTGNIKAAAGEENAYQDSVTGALIRVNEDNTLSVGGSIKKAGTVKLAITYADGTTVAGNLQIKLSKITKPTEPADPTEPTDPTKPTDPTEPTDPTKPTDPTEPTDPTKPTDTTVPTVEDNDKTGYNPKEWSWTAEGEGYGRKYFTSGKYVRDDGTAVIYLDSGDSCDGFSYQLYEKEGGAHQSSYEARDYENGSSYATASNTGEMTAVDKSNGISFKSLGNGCMMVETDWIDEMYLQYDDPGGVYYLVREKK